MKEVYIVTEYWQHDGEGGVYPHLFSTYEKAKQFFDDCIKEDMENGLSSNSFTSNDVECCGEVFYGEVFYEEQDHDKNYALEEINEPDKSQHYWCWFEKGWYNDCHSGYKLEKQIFDEE